MQNNLFRYATSELSQDAFIAWLASYALEDSEPDLALRECADKMLRAFVPELKDEQFKLENVERQVKNIDILFTLTAGDTKYKVVVEDKINTEEHNNQLNKYLQYIHSEYPQYKARGVYYKTGFQSDWSAVESAGYQIVTLSQVLEIMSSFMGKTQNDIFIDYYTWWENRYEEALSYNTLPILRWKSPQIFAFYDYLQNSNFAKNRNAWLKYGYVSNRSGGFYGLWMGSRDDIIEINGIKCEFYLQIEAKRSRDVDGYVFPICLKMAITPDEGQVFSACDIRNDVVYDETRQYRIGDFHFCRPSRMASGKHMTIGVYDASYENAAQLEEALSAAYEEYQRFLSALPPAG